MRELEILHIQASDQEAVAVGHTHLGLRLEVEDKLHQPVVDLLMLRWPLHRTRRPDLRSRVSFDLQQRKLEEPLVQSVVRLDRWPAPRHDLLVDGPVQVEHRAMRLGADLPLHQIREGQSEVQE